MRISRWWKCDFGVQKRTRNALLVHREIIWNVQVWSRKYNVLTRYTAKVSNKHMYRVSQQNTLLQLHLTSGKEFHNVDQFQRKIKHVVLFWSSTLIHKHTIILIFKGNVLWVHYNNGSHQNWCDATNTMCHVLNT